MIRYEVGQREGKKIQTELVSEAMRDRKHACSRGGRGAEGRADGMLWPGLWNENRMG